MKDTKRKTKELFINQCIEKFGNEYDYSKVEYINNRTKVKIICHIHGEFELTPSNHLRGKGCPKCINKNLSTLDWIVKANIVHENKYDYSKTVFIKGHKEVVIICPEHGEFVLQASSHLLGCGCPKCKNLKLQTDRTKGKELFISEAKMIHLDKYDYSKVEYVNNRTKIIIECPIHGLFTQTPSSHLRGCGCPKCNKFCVESKGEKLIKLYLLDNNIKFISLYNIPIDKNINFSGNAYIDFYLPDYNIFVEYNGELHYREIKYFLNYNFSRQQSRDNYIKKYCAGNNIELLEIPYTLKEDEILSNLADKLAVEASQEYETKKE